MPMTMHGNDGATRLARGLGWFSLGLGLAEVAAPGQVARLIGVRDERFGHGAIRAVGVRELSTGVGILASRRRRRWLWLRLGGDVIDLALLAAALRSRPRERDRLLTATAAVLGVTAIDVLAARRQRRAAERRRTQELTRTITINRRPEEIYDFWRDLENLPQFMAHVCSVERLDERRSHWTVEGVAGRSLEWDAEIVEDEPGEIIAWRTLGDADVQHAGWMRLTPAPGGRGTEVRVKLQYTAPGGRLATTIASLFGKAPGQQIQGDLRRLKQVLEVGEVVHSDASIHRGRHPARPAGGGRRLPRATETAPADRTRDQVGQRPELAPGVGERL